MPKTRSALGCKTILAACALTVLSGTTAAAWAPLNRSERRLNPDEFFIDDFIGKPIDEACYRLTAAQLTDDSCPEGYKSPLANRCWAECPMQYPVQCGFECLTQGTTCTDAVAKKGKVVAEAAMNFLSGGVYGVVSKLYEQATHWVTCAKAVDAVTKEIGKNYPDKKPLPLKDTAAMTKILKESATAINAALLACVNFDVKKYATDKVEKLRKAFLAELNKIKVDAGLEDLTEDSVKTLFTGQAGAAARPSAAVRTRGRRLGLTQSTNKQPDAKKPQAGADAQKTTTATDTKPTPAGAGTKSTTPQNSQTGLGMLAKCGDPIRKAFEKLRDEGEKLWTDSGTPEKVRSALTASKTLLEDVPAAVLKCVDKKLPELYSKILSAVYAMVDKIIDGIVEKKLTKAQVAVMAVDEVLGAIAKFDTSGIAGLLQEFWQPVCGPTVFPKPISVGEAKKAVALNPSGWAFKVTSGKWGTKVAANGTVSIGVKNNADREVTVKIMSAGETIEDIEIKVPPSEEKWWNSKEMETAKTISLTGKTLLLWRSVNLRLAVDPVAGGSVLAWVPTNPGTLTLQISVEDEESKAAAPANEGPGTVTGNAKATAGN